MAHHTAGEATYKVVMLSDDGALAYADLSATETLYSDIRVPVHKSGRVNHL